MKNIVLPLALGALALSGCTQQVVVAESAASIFLTRPSTPPPADTQSQIAEHESWCYKTMATTECYTKAQDVAPTRLVNVDPQNVYPLTPQAYHDEVAGIRPAGPATGKPMALNSSAADPAEKKSYFEKLTGYKFSWDTLSWDALF
jgi:hypothetical protein